MGHETERNPASELLRFARLVTLTRGWQRRRDGGDLSEVVLGQCAYCEAKLDRGAAWIVKHYGPGEPGNLPFPEPQPQTGPYRKGEP